MLRHKKVLVGGLCALAAVLGIATTALASLPAGTKVTGNLKTGTDMTFAGNINGVPITVSCTKFTGTSVVPKTPSYTVSLKTPPTISGCTDSLKGKDTITTNATNGKWKLTISKASPYSVTLVIPKDGATFSSSLLPSCVITAAPTATVNVKGSYSPTAGTDTVTKQPIPVKGTGCTATSSTTSATVVFTPNPGTPPF